MTAHIQINDVQPRIHYVADGIQGAFSFPFAIFKAEDLEVWLDDVKQTSGYTVSGAGVSTGGTALLASPPAPGTGVTLRRRLALARTTDYQSDGLIRAKTLNDELDFQVAAVQQVAEELGRAVKRSPTSTSSTDLTLPEPAPRRALRWNDDATRLVNSETDPDAGGNATQAAIDAIAARDVAVAAAGGVRISLDDATVAPLGVKLVAGDGITLTESADGGDERLTVASTAGQAVLDRLAFLEANLAVNTLRDQIDAGWSVLKMVDGWADEFADESGIDPAASVGEFHDAGASFYTNQGLGTYTVQQSSNSAASPGADMMLAQSFTVSTTSPIAGAKWRNYTAAATTADWSIEADASGSPSGIRLATVWGVLSPSTSLTDQAITFDTPFTPAAGTTYWLVARKTGGGYLPTNFWAYYNGNVYANGTGFWGGTSQAADFTFSIRQSSPAADMVLVSNGFTAQSAPTEARLLLLHEAADPVTLNTDLVAEVSRDGGATWTAAALADEGPFDGSTGILSGIADLSAQPAGTAMKWRIRTLNAKSQRLHGVWFQWR